MCVVSRARMSIVMWRLGQAVAEQSRCWAAIRTPSHSPARGRRPRATRPQLAAKGAFRRGRAIDNGLILWQR